jgi:hypothetical protein
MYPIASKLQLPKKSSSLFSAHPLRLLVARFSRLDLFRIYPLSILINGHHPAFRASAHLYRYPSQISMVLLAAIASTADSATPGGATSTVLGSLTPLQSLRIVSPTTCASSMILGSIPYVLIIDQPLADTFRRTEPFEPTTCPETLRTYPARTVVRVQEVRAVSGRGDSEVPEST